ncbi:hypothetical protein Tco_1299830, partial [Tanacetum coccineum]
MSTMDRLRDIPESEIVDKVKISYDGLKPVEKELFLEIACFFRRRLKRDAMEIFDACGFHPGIGIKENDQIEAIKFGHDIHWPKFIMLISKMKKLRWLHLIGDNKGNVDAPNCLSNEL